MGVNSTDLAHQSRVRTGRRKAWGTGSLSRLRRCHGAGGFREVGLADVELAKLLREAARISHRYVLIAEHRAGRTAAEHAINTQADAHGTYRSESEWQELLTSAGLQLVASGPMLAPNRPEAYFIARKFPTA